MRNIIFLCVAIILMQSVSAQNPCLPEGIWITTQEQIDSFPINYPSCTEIEGTVYIEGENITNLDGFNQIKQINGELKLFYTTQLGNLNGLNNLKSIGHLQIGLNQNLSTLDGLDSVTTIQGFMGIVGNPSLSNVDALNNLTYIAGPARISENESLQSISLNSLVRAGVPYPGGTYFEIAHNGSLQNLDGINNLRIVKDLQIVFNPSLNVISGLTNLDTIHGGLDISANDSLTEITGLPKLKSIIDGHPEVALNFRLNPNLTSIDGFDSLNLIEGGCTIEKNYSLPSLEGLNNLQQITGLIDINLNTCLTDLYGLAGLCFVEEIHIWKNDSLTDIIGISNITADSMEYLKIMGNMVLTECAVESVCGYLTEYNGLSWIANNGIGCNSADEIIEACESEGVDNMAGSYKVTVYPNPARNGRTTISFDHFDRNLVLKIYNTFCQQIYLQDITAVKTHIDLRLWSPGLYLIVIEKNGRTVSTSKLTCN